MLSHFEKARALGDWLLNRHNLSLTYPADDPRHGIPAGNDEGDTFIGTEYDDGTHWLHYYASAAESYRGFMELGAVWERIGRTVARDDVAAHGAELLAAAPLLRRALHASLNLTTQATGNPAAPRCVPTVADPRSDNASVCDQSCSFRSYSEMMYAGVLTRQQVDDIYSFGRNGSSGNYRFVTLGSPGYNHKQTTYTAYGWAFGLLQHDFVSRYLLHWFAMSAHTFTRGTWTTPEATHPDRDVASTAYVAAGLLTAPLYLKWALVFEDPESRTIWLAKALPRDWLDAGQTVVAAHVPTRHGRVSMVLKSVAASLSSPYQVHANVTLPAKGFVDDKPPGGLRLRLRVPSQYAGRLSAVAVGGIPWAAYNATAETIDFAADKLTPALLGRMQSIVASFSTSQLSINT